MLKLPSFSKATNTRSNYFDTPLDSSVNLSENNFRLGELFAGAGGMALGAHLTSYKNNKFSHVWANDIDSFACQTFFTNLPIERADVHCCDVSAIKLESLSEIDGLLFGFPCNDFSIVGNRQGIKGNFGGLYKQCIRVLKAKRPLFFIAENVGGLSSSGDALKIIEGQLKDSGYNTFRKLYKFEEFGVPQCRHRIIIVGFRNDTEISDFNHPNPTTVDNPVSCEEALRGVQACTNNNEHTNHSKLVLERLRFIKPGQNIFTAELPKHLELNMSSNAKISQIYRRLRPDKPAYTVTGSGGGGTHVYHWHENRALTNRERARLQTFPDNFIFKGGKESVRKQIGMAVPPKGAKAIFKAVLKTLLKHKIHPES